MRKRTKRKVYALINPVAHAIAGAAITDKGSLDQLRVAELSAIDAISRGLGGLGEYRVLADMLNVCERMATNGIGPEAFEFCQAFNDELEQMAVRYEATGKMRFTGLGMKLARDIFDFHDLQRQSITRAEYERMIKKTADYIRSNGHLVVNIE